jgi:hypothetical protein
MTYVLSINASLATPDAAGFYLGECHLKMRAGPVGSAIRARRALRVVRDTKNVDHVTKGEFLGR